MAVKRPITRNWVGKVNKAIEKIAKRYFYQFPEPSNLGSKIYDERVLEINKVISKLFSGQDGNTIPVDTVKFSKWYGRFCRG